MIEKEFKYLLLNSPAVEQEAREQAIEVRHIQQGYFDKGGRIRRSAINRNRMIIEKYTFTYKHTLRDGSGIMEIETEISSEEFKRLWPDTSHKLIKLRYNVPFENHIWEIDCFRKNDSEDCYLMLAECEVDEHFVGRPNQPQLVEKYLKYEVEENDPRFTNRRLSNPEHVERLMKTIEMRAFIDHVG